MKLKVSTLLCLCLLVVITSARTWTDTEKRTMDAELVRVEGQEAIFQKPSGMRYRFPIAKLCEADRDFISENPLTQTTTASASASAVSLPETELTEWLTKRLVARDSKRVKRARESALPQAEYIALYFSAKWCPPCRAFTPKLVDFYNEQRDKNSNFEIIFVSSDRDEESQEAYMLEDQMPWPAVEFDDARDKMVRKYSGTGIPCLVIVDREGKVIADSYVNGKYLGPTRVMNQLSTLLSK
ncbi:thioredoxin family protein [Coraliomargarita sp. W4R53]